MVMVMGNHGYLWWMVDKQVKTVLVVDDLIYLQPGILGFLFPDFQ